MQPLLMSAVGENDRPFKQVVLRNAARCDTCGDVVESKYRHDFKSCSCEKIFVDGGYDYIRRGFSGPYTDLSVSRFIEMTNEEVQQYHEWGLV